MDFWSGLRPFYIALKQFSSIDRIFVLFFYSVQVRDEDTANAICLQKTAQKETQKQINSDS